MRKKSFPVARFRELPKEAIRSQRLPLKEYLQELMLKGVKMSTVKTTWRIIRTFLRKYTPVCEEDWYKFLSFWTTGEADQRAMPCFLMSNNS